MSRKILSGVVVSTKAQKTAIVKVATAKRHKKYGKRYVSHKRYQAHYEKLEIQEGSEVTIKEIAPVSKTKKWLITEVHN